MPKLIIQYKNGDLQEFSNYSLDESWVFETALRNPSQKIILRGTEIIPYAIDAYTVV